MHDFKREELVVLVLSFQKASQTNLVSYQYFDLIRFHDFKILHLCS